MSAQPWMKFYPTDWRSDPCLRMCSLAARGLWMEMLMLMHEAKPYGFLVVKDRTPTDAQLAVLAGTSTDQISELLGELESAGVFSRTGKGIIYSRRMTRDDKKARIARKNGVMGGNPTLCNQTKIPPLDNQIPTNPLNPQIPEARVQIQESKKESPPTPPLGEGGDLFSDLASMPAKPLEPVSVQPEVGSVPMAEPTKPAKPKKARPAALYTQAEIEGWFEKFMVVYPNRDKVHSVNGAKKIFGAMLKRQVSPEAIIAAATRYCQEVRNNGHFGTQYTKDAYNWLNEGKWKDYSGVHMFPVPEPEWKTNPRAWTDRNHPPPWPDAPLGAKAGMWTKTSRIWVRYAS